MINLKKILGNSTLVKVEGDMLTIDKKGTFFSNSKMCIKIKDITGLLEWNEIIIVLGKGIYTEYELNEKNKERIKSQPNTIIGEKNEIEDIYAELYILLQNVPNM